MFPGCRINKQISEQKEGGRNPKKKALKKRVEGTKTEVRLVGNTSHQEILENNSASTSLRRNLGEATAAHPSTFAQSE